MMISVSAPDRVRWRLLLAAAVLIGLQIAALSHVVGHSAAGDSAGCAICLATSGSGSAIPPAAVILPVFHSTTVIRVEPVAGALPAPIAASYRARAPPVSV